MKYIDADKLKVLLSDLKEEHKHYRGDFHEGVVYAVDALEEDINDSLQQDEKVDDRWQPCDEHFRALGYAIEYFKKKKNDTTYLEDLYNGLKKLF